MMRILTESESHPRVCTLVGQHSIEIMCSIMLVTQLYFCERKILDLSFG